MTQSARAQEPSMEEILASIRRIIADDEPVKTAPPPPKPEIVAPPPTEPAVENSAAMGQDDIDALLSGFDEKAIPDTAPEPEPEPQSTQVLELTDAVPLPAQAKSNGISRIEPRADVVFREVAELPPPPAPAVRPAPAQEALPTGGSPILSQAASAAVSSAFSSLTHTILSNNARTLEDLVQDMLRPMLKQWLDENLPTVVEHLVRAEIERVSRGRG
ncbi:MAG: DUF2497 domain-containing protein [Bacteroidales bacterium]|nr:DUF2497 domain-containing protein [Bacteroidales bacterium]